MTLKDAEMLARIVSVLTLDHARAWFRQDDTFEFVVKLMGILEIEYDQQTEARYVVVIEREFDRILIAIG